MSDVNDEATEVDDVTSTLNSRLGALDAVRGAAILGVVATHSLTATISVTQSEAFPPMLFRLFADGLFGVQLFFVLSGFLLFLLYRDAVDYSSATYWGRRVARIWPLWIVFVVAYYAVIGAPPDGPAPAVAMILSLLFLGWLSPALLAVPQGGITIMQEMGHYALFAALRRRSVDVLAITVIVGYFSYFLCLGLQKFVSGGVVRFVADSWMDFGLFRTWPYFVLGGFTYLVYSAVRGGAVSWALTKRRALLLSLAIVLSFFVPVGYGVSNAHAIGVLLLAALVAIFLNSIPVAGHTLRVVGRYAYFIYFFHFWALRWIEDWFSGRTLPGMPAASVQANVATLGAIYIAAVALSVAAAAVSWRCFEGPIVRMSHLRRKPLA